MSKNCAADPPSLFENNLESDGAGKTASPSPQQTEWKSLDTQVGGHTFSHGEYEHRKLGMVDLGNGLILKSLQNPPRGIRELSFYRKIFDPNCDDPDLLELRPFVSPFHGTEKKGGAEFLKLTNLTCGFKHPCVIDIKMGRVTYDQEATAEKIALEVEKYPPLQALGYQITGMIVYNFKTQSNEQYERVYCRNLTEENIVCDGLGQFFQLHNNNLRKDLIQPLLSRLKKLETWFLRQKKYSFIASSLLIIYDGSNQPTETSNISEGNNQNIDKNKNDQTLSKENSCSVASSPALDSVGSDDSSNVHVHKRVSGEPIHFEDKSIKRVKLSEANTDSDLSGNEHYPVSLADSSSGKGIEVRLIDFAHVFPAADVDHNFLYGLQKLIEGLEMLLEY